jgi:hypothetical protein
MPLRGVAASGLCRFGLTVTATISALVHELIELRLVLCPAQTAEEALEVRLLFLQAAKSLFACLTSAPMGPNSVI